jgi:hypothetical protein
MSGCRITKELYLKSEIQGAARGLRVLYADRGANMIQRSSHSSRSDISDYPDYTRASRDHGRTWSGWEETTPFTEEADTYISDTNEICRVYSSVAGHHVRMSLRRSYLKEQPEDIRHLEVQDRKNFFDHVYCELSDDGCRTWHSRQQMRYESAPEETEESRSDAQFLRLNEMMGTINTRALVLPTGRIVHPVMIHSGKCGTPGHNTEGLFGLKYCTLPLVADWDGISGRYAWSHAAPLSVTPDTSSRGIFEPYVVRLTDGRLFLDMRGSSTPSTAGRRWSSLSDDDGRTWSGAVPLRYDTGESFYSPSAMTRMIRSTKTGGLYWVGNICATEPRGNWPRYPLCMALVDEEKCAIVRSSLETLDTKGRDDSADLKLSNFVLIENRETLDLEIYCTRLHALGNADWTSDVYRYTVSF